MNLQQITEKLKNAVETVKKNNDSQSQKELLVTLSEAVLNIAEEVDTLRFELDTALEIIDDIEEDICRLEEDVYEYTEESTDYAEFNDETKCYDIACLNCGNTVSIDYASYENSDGNGGQLRCPNCGDVINFNINFLEDD
jgi:DNA-directed RNA polymerase subunit RPC12/RpoP